jgi:hypothetical protein
MSDVIPRAEPPNHPSDSLAAATCASCGAPLAPDQRYCLSCGHPCSPVRLAFLDVLQGEYQSPTGVGAPNAFANGMGGPPSGIYAPPPEPDGLLGSLRRYSGLFGLLGVLLVALLIGLFVGHWLGGSPSSGPQVLKVDLDTPLAAVPPAVSTTGTSSTSSSSHSGSGSSTNAGASHSHSPSKSEEKAEEVQEAKEVAKPKALPPAHKASTTIEKLAHSTGKKHAEEESKLGDAPIETGH